MVDDSGSVDLSSRLHPSESSIVNQRLELVSIIRVDGGLVREEERHEFVVRLLPRVRSDEVATLDAPQRDVALSGEVLPRVRNVRVIGVAGRWRVEPPLAPIRVDEKAFVLGQRQVLLSGQAAQLVRDDDLSFIEGAAGEEPTSAETAFADADIWHDVSIAPVRERARRQAVLALSPGDRWQVTAGSLRSILTLTE